MNNNAQLLEAIRTIVHGLVSARFSGVEGMQGEIILRLDRMGETINTEAERIRHIEGRVNEYANGGCKLHHALASQVGELTRVRAIQNGVAKDRMKLLEFFKPAIYVIVAGMTLVMIDQLRKVLGG